VEICAPSRVLAWGSELYVHVFLRTWTLKPHSGKLSDDACAIRHCSGDVAEIRRAASSSYQTLSQFFPQHYLLHPRSPKRVCPDKRVCLACLPSFQTWTLAAWLWPGPDSQLSKLSFRGAPSSTTPCPSPPPDTAGLPDL